MKHIITAIRQQERTPIFVLVTISLITLVTYGLEYFGMYSEETEMDSYMSLGSMVGVGIFLTAILLFVVIGFMRSIKYDRLQNKISKDEREVLHDQVVATIGYKTAVYALALYVFFVGDLIMLGLLSLVMLTSLYKRYQIVKSDV